MPNELVRVGPPANAPDTEDDEEWNLPPLPPAAQTTRPAPRAGTASYADRDAQAADARGDDTYATLRETDAAEQRQSPWDWGDLKTWAVIWALFFGFLLFTAFVYFLPTGRHNQNDGPNSTPPIRVY